MQHPRIATKLYDLTLTAIRRNGQTAIVDSVDVGFALPHGDSSTVTDWLTVAVTGGIGTFAVSGPSVDPVPPGGLVVPAIGGGLWAKVTDAPEVDAHFIEHFSLT